MGNSIYQNNWNRIKDILEVDDGLRGVLDEDYKSLYVSARNPFILFFAYVGLAVLYFFVRLFYKLNTRLDTVKDEFVFFSCPDVIFRVRNMPLIASECRYSMIFLPTFHLRSAIEYNRYFKQQGVKAVFLMPTICDAFSIVKNRIKYRKDYSALRLNDHQDLLRLKNQLFTYLVYKSIAERTLGRVDGGKVIFEHQKFFFIPFVCWYKNRGRKTYLLQHGSFFHPSYNYLPLLCDVVLCCSEREKGHYLRNGVSDDRVIVFGTPLQSMRPLSSVKEKQPPIFKFLVLLTLVNEENRSFQSKVLLHLKRTLPADSVLVRLRPRSAASDSQMLASELDGMTISAPGTSLSDDVDKAECVITFSEDCVFELCRSGCRFIIASCSRSIDPLLDGKYCTEDDYVLKLEEFNANPDNFLLSREDRMYLFGDLDTDSLARKFTDFIKHY